MKKILRLFLFLFLALSFTACVDEDVYEDSPSGNFEALWKIMDEHYCFFQEKVSTGTLSMPSMHPVSTRA